ncbi:MAG: glucose-6-phosphate dehydrogenase [Parachlamydiaceae bacterium]
MIDLQLTNPLEDPSRLKKNVEPCVLIIFGATGDLTSRKLVPALYNLAREGQLPGHFACVGFARREKSNETFRQEMLDGVNKFSRIRPVEKEVWSTFNDQIFYHQSEFHEDAGYESLARLLHQIDLQFGTKGNRVFYLSTQPSFFPLIIEKLSKHKLIYDVDQVQDKWSRVVIEKPFGHDLQSAQQLQNEISKYLDESQIYRIDHYLGKETVQNILVFRFSNSIFESLWNNNHIDHVQITVSEEIGIGTRGRLWEEAGMLRDIVQNHMMQLLSLVTMEPPTTFRADAIHAEKIKVMESIRPLPPQQFSDLAVRGQYGLGYIEGKEVKGYRQEDNVAADSSVETYVALKLAIDNWRWSGVPFYLRAGKRLPKRATEIAIVFKNAPGYLFHTNTRKNEPNTLVIRIQPDEGISLKMNCKIPGFTSLIQPVKMDFQYGTYFGATPPEAYERLICDCMSGDSTLFARADEALASWRLLTPLLNFWQSQKPADFPNYPSGSWGPKAAEALITRDGRQWRLI